MADGKHEKGPGGTGQHPRTPAESGVPQSISMTVVEEGPPEFMPPPVRPAPMISGGSGTINYMCGACGHKLLERFKPGQLQLSDAAIECPMCGAKNNT